jgi:PAP2 superfamily
LLTPRAADALSLAYTAYFALPPAIVAALLIRRRTSDAYHALLTLLAAFYLHYAIYMLVPVVGPARTPEFPAIVRWQLAAGGGVITHHLRAIIGSLEGTAPDAFPSAHTSVTCLVVALA